MLRKAILVAIGTFGLPLSAQVNSTGAPLQVASPNEAPAAVLPANTEVLLRMNQEVTTKGKRWKEGDTFNLSVVHDVLYGPYVAIPKGSRAVGRITWLTDKGAFGKSGKMDIDLEYVEVGGRRIDIDGTYRQEGEGNTVATIGGVIVAGVLAGFITGRSGTIPRGRELMAHTQSDLALALPQGASPSVASANSPLPESLPVEPLQVRSSRNSSNSAAPKKPATQKRDLRNSAIRCVTC